MRILRRTALLLAIAATTAGASRFSDLEQREQSAAAAVPHLNVIVTMKEKRPSGLLDMKAIRRRLQKSCDADAPDHVAVMIDGLKQFATESHATVLAAVNDQAPETTHVQSLWITNEVSVRNATQELVEALRALPEVGDVRQERVARLPITNTYANVSATVSTSTTTLANSWALERIQATQAWDQGFNGTGMRVAAADSGVLATHETLTGRMVPEFGWFDSVDSSATPIDPLGHGTSVMSILTGSNGIGVAPQASWIACRACDDGGDCDESWMLSCAQFLICPFNADQQTDCSKRPHVINMSWNYDSTDERGLETVVDAWLAAGIVPVFSNGNTGSKCKSVRSPADWTSGITVGATTSADNIVSISSRGPNAKGEIKPDLTAPGMDVEAAQISSSSAVGTFSGTSASAPFVGGAVALMLQANPALTPTKIKALLTSSTDQMPLVAHIKDSCLATTPTDTTMQFPNNVYGYGRLNVLNAVNQAIQTVRRR